MNLEKELSKLTVKELRSRLAKAGLTGQGKKSDLVDRLVAYQTAEAAPESIESEPSEPEAAPTDESEPEAAEDDSEGEWVNVTERLPLPSTPVYISDGVHVDEATYFEGQEGPRFVDASGCVVKATYWAPRLIDSHPESESGPEIEIRASGPVEIVESEFLQGLTECAQCGASIEPQAFNGPQLCENCVRGLTPNPQKPKVKTTVLPGAASPTVDRIYQSYVRKNRDRSEGQSIPVGAVGHECDRKIWYGWRWAMGRNFSGQLLRLFETGNIEEDRVVNDLRAIGVQVWNTRADMEGPFQIYEVADVPQSGASRFIVYNRNGKPLASLDSFRAAHEWAEKYGEKQIKMTWFDGHLSGRSDGVCKGLEEAPKTPHKLEIKSANDKNFAKITGGELHETKPEHWGQLQLGMNALGLRRGAYFIVNKNDDEIHMDRVEYDPAYCATQLDRIKRIIEAETPPPKLSESASFWKCKYCDFLETCHYGKAPGLSCRTCAHATPVLDGSGGDADQRGKWVCEAKRGATPHLIPIDRQQVGCNYHLFIPGLIGGLEYRGADQQNNPPHWIEYVDEWGERVANVISTEIDGPAEVAKVTGGTVAFRSHEFPSPILKTEPYAKLREHLDECPF